MKLYFIHASDYPNYKENLYEPLRKSSLEKEHALYLPHEKTADSINSKKLIDDCDLIIAEASYPSTGMGIELGWANLKNKPVLFIYKKGAKVSSSLKQISDDFLEYQDKQEFISQISSWIEENQEKFTQNKSAMLKN